MSAVLSIQRVNALPGVLIPSTMYIVKAAEAAYAELWFSSSDGLEARRLINKADIAAMIAAAGGGGGGGSSATADALTTARSITITGDASWTVNFDGSGNVTSALQLADTGIGAGEYFAITVDSKGRAVSGRALTAADIPNLPGSKINSDLNVNTSGNAATATALQTARTINGVSFDGTNDITINAEDAIPRIAAIEKGAINGVATLDVNGKVPASQLPSFVDDVVEVANTASLPVTGEAGKLYITLDDGAVHRWTGSVYVAISSSAGSADTAVRLVTARTISATGDATWSVNFDGSANATGTLTLADTGITAGEHLAVTFDSKGRAVSGRALVANDIPTLDYNKVTSSAGVNLAVADW